MTGLIQKSFVWRACLESNQAPTDYEKKPVLLFELNELQRISKGV